MASARMAARLPSPRSRSFRGAVLAHHFPSCPEPRRHDRLQGVARCSCRCSRRRNSLPETSASPVLRLALGRSRVATSCSTYVAIARPIPGPGGWFGRTSPASFRTSGGRSFGALLGLLTGQIVQAPSGGWQSAGFVEGIESAYGVAWRVVDAQYCRVDGFPHAVPQRRRRVFVVGHLETGGDALAVLLERASLRILRRADKRGQEAAAPDVSFRLLSQPWLGQSGAPKVGQGIRRSPSLPPAWWRSAAVRGRRHRLDTQAKAATTRTPPDLVAHALRAARLSTPRTAPGAGRTLVVAHTIGAQSQVR